MDTEGLANRSKQLQPMQETLPSWRKALPL